MFAIIVTIKSLFFYLSEEGRMLLVRVKVHGVYKSVFTIVLFIKRIIFFFFSQKNFAIAVKHFFFFVRKKTAFQSLEVHDAKKCPFILITLRVMKYVTSNLFERMLKVKSKK